MAKGAIPFEILVRVVGHGDGTKHCRQGARDGLAGAGRSSDIQKLYDFGSNKCVAKFGCQHVSDAFDE